MEVIKGIGFLILLVGLFPQVHHILHMFQQNKYDYRRYFIWIRDTYKKGIIDLLLIFTIALVQYLLKKQLVSIIYFIYVYVIYFKKTYIKPLVYTSRIKRILCVLFLIDLLFIYLFYGKLSSYSLYLLHYLNWVLVIGADIILKPIEYLIKEKYINEAKSILKNSPNLKKIGITGSFGKTSTKNIVQAILSENYRSLMTPASYNTPMGITRTIREYLKPIHQIFVCEMGADHVGDISYLCDFVKPDIGVVTSIGEQHLATFLSLDNIIKEKMQMVERLEVDKVAILNYDNQYIRNYKIKNKCNIITYGIDETDVDCRAFDIKFSNKGTDFKVDYQGEVHEFSTILLGKHNISNILVGIIIARLLNTDFKQIKRAIKNIPYIEHRLEPKIINNRHFIDNAFNSNPVGSKMSLDVLEMMPNKRFIVTPGMIDLGKIQDEKNFEFGQYMKGKCDYVILVGQNQTKKIKEGLIDVNFDMDKVFVCDTVVEAFKLVYKLSDENDTILLENDLPDAFNN